MDPLAGITPNWSPYRYAYNNPIKYIDLFGLFESRKEARAYKRDHEISGSIVKNKDGSFSINDKKNHVSYTKGIEGSNEVYSNDGVQESILVTGKKKQDYTGEDLLFGNN